MQVGTLVKLVTVIVVLIIGLAAFVGPTAERPYPIFPLLPPLLAIVLAIVTRQVLPALFVGVWIGALMVVGYDPLAATTQALGWIIDNATDSWNATILIFDFIIGAFVGVLYASGAMHSVAAALSKYVKTARGSSFIGWVLGLAVFFDDYTNTIVVGNTVRPITDRTRVSRELLSYIVDSTAAPVAGLAVVSTWIGYEVGLIRSSFEELGIDLNAYAAWLQSVPYRYYSILAIVLVLLVVLTRRHIGPMLKAEHRAVREGKVLRDGAQPLMPTETVLGEPPAMRRASGWVFAAAVLVLIIVTLGGMWVTGGMSLAESEWHEEVFSVVSERVEQFVSTNTTAYVPKANVSQLASLILSVGEKLVSEEIGFEEGVSLIASNISMTYNVPFSTAYKAAEYCLAFFSETYNEVSASIPMKPWWSYSFGDALMESDSATALLWGSFAAYLVALVGALASRALTFIKAMEYTVKGMYLMVYANAILLLAWSIKSAVDSVGTADYVVGLATGAGVPALLVPLIIFLVSMFISFTTGTSWGTFGVMMPIAIPMAWKLAVQQGVDPYLVTFAAIASVFSGGIFGDHCSPISDTTIMSSMFSAADHIDHVNTQIPYAVLAASVGIILYLLFATGVTHWAILLPIGIALLIVFHRVLNVWYAKKVGLPPVVPNYVVAPPEGEGS